MARSRNIKPGLFKNEILGEADPLLTILFQGLWCLADRDGKLEDRPKRIKAEIFPYRELPDFNGYLTELAQLGFIERYTVGKQAIVKVFHFAKHQSPHKTEKASELPDKPLEIKTTVKAPLNNETLTEEAALIPDSLLLIPSTGRFAPPTPKDVHEYMITRDCKQFSEAEKFCDFYISKNWMINKTKMKDWQASARNWVRRKNEDAEIKTTKQSSPSKHYSEVFGNEGQA